MIHQPPMHLLLGRGALWENRSASLHVCRPSPTTLLGHAARSALEPQPRRAPARLALDPTRGQGRLPGLQGSQTLSPRQPAPERSSTPPVPPATSQNGPRPRYVRRGSTWSGPSLSRYSSTLHHHWNSRRVPAGFSQLALLASSSLAPPSKPCTGARCLSCP